MGRALLWKILTCLRAKLSISVGLLFWIAFCLLPSASVYCGMYAFPGTGLGKFLFVFTKILFFGGPLYVFFIRQRRKLRELCRVDDTAQALLLGLAAGVIIVLAYALLGTRLIDEAELRTGIASLNLDNMWLFSGGAIYWCLGNSFLEEFVWRYFIFERFAKILSKVSACVLVALLFTVHHSLAMAVYFNPVTNVIASLGIFGASLLWSWLRLRNNNLWPCYISHIFADIAIFAVGAYLLF